MNTKILFCCTNVCHNEFQKIIFETILHGNSIKSISDAIDWMDDNISMFCYDFDLEFVIDWFVLLCESTDEDDKDTEIVKTVNGKLIFEDDNDYHYYKLGKITNEINEIKEEINKIKEEKKIKEDLKTKKNYPSAWIEPTGELHEIGFACHNDFAHNWLEENDKDSYAKVSNAFNRYYYEALEELGWIRILGWTDPPKFVITKRVTPKQRITLKDYCLNNDVPYQSFPEILKS